VAHRRRRITTVRELGHDQQMTLAIPPSRGLFGTVRSVAGWTVDTATLRPDVDALLNVFRDVREGLVGIPA